MQNKKTLILRRAPGVSSVTVSILADSNKAKPEFVDEIHPISSDTRIETVTKNFYKKIPAKGDCNTPIFTFFHNGKIHPARPHILVFTRKNTQKNRSPDSIIHTFSLLQNIHTGGISENLFLLLNILSYTFYKICQDVKNPCRKSTKKCDHSSVKLLICRRNFWEKRSETGFFKKWI